MKIFEIQVALNFLVVFCRWVVKLHVLAHSSSWSCSINFSFDCLWCWINKTNRYITLDFSWDKIFERWITNQNSFSHLELLAQLLALSYWNLDFIELSWISWIFIDLLLKLLLDLSEVFLIIGSLNSIFVRFLNFRLMLNNHLINILKIALLLDEANFNWFNWKVLIKLLIGSG